MPSATKYVKITVLLLLCIFIVRLYPTYGQTQADVWYVNQACTVCGDGTIVSPYQSIWRGVSFADAGDMLLVAQGTYTENVSIDDAVTLLGGYAATSPTWTRDIEQYATIVTSAKTGTQGDWNGDWLGFPSVVKDGSTYKIYYSAGNEISGESIGYADSPDGVNWFIPYIDPLLLAGADGAWDQIGVSAPTILKMSSGFRMWYVGTNALGIKSIGVATSPDGLSWDRYTGNPLIVSTTSIDDSFGFPSVIQQGPDDYKMWYSQGWRILLATSSDGYTWELYDGGPVLTPGTLGAWDEAGVYAPMVIAGSQGYEMWYTAESWTSSGPSIGYAWSSDGINWTKSPQNPVLSGELGAWDEMGSAYPAVLSEGPTDYKMWYQGITDSQFGFGYAASSDGISWGKYAGNPVLNQGQSTRWGSPVFTISDTSGDAVLDGFTITGAVAGYGGGIYTVGNSVTIRNCTIINNIVQSSGAGVYIYSGSPTVENTLISGNRTVSGWAGGIYAGRTSLTVTDSVIEGNAARETGGGIVVRSDTRLDMDNSTVSGNVAKRGGAIYLTADSAINVDDSFIDGNFAEQIAGIRAESNSTLNITNTFIVDNHATTGGVGAINFSQISGRLVNVTVAGNSAAANPGGINYYSSQPGTELVIINSILAFNGGDDISCSEGICNVTYSDVQEGIAGTGNLAVDPLFMNLPAGDYHLRMDSPVINAGTSAGAPAFDFEGDPRPIGAVDMGADEVPITYTDQVYIPLVVK